MLTSSANLGLARWSWAPAGCSIIALLQEEGLAAAGAQSWQWVWGGTGSLGTAQGFNRGSY